MKRPAVAALMLTTSFLLSGCATLLGYTVARLAPPPKVPAAYDPPKDKQLLVMVDDPYQRATSELLKRQLSEEISRRLVSEDVVASTVPYDRLMDVMLSHPEFQQLSVSEIGRKCGADMVLVVEITDFSVRDRRYTPLWKGTLETEVRLVDVEEGRLWPVDTLRGHRVEPIETPETQEDSPSYGSKLTKELAAQMADRISKLFYEHRGNPVTGDTNSG
ncbi:MAG: hypothetical protein ACLFVU_10505 [Phycisphaerae bacterium]